MPALFGSIFWKMATASATSAPQSAYCLIMFQAFIAFDQARGRSHPLFRRERAPPRALPL